MTTTTAAAPMANGKEEKAHMASLTQTRTGGLKATSDVERIEAPVTVKAYLLCAFAAFAGILYGYDSGYINGVTGSKVFIEIIEGPGHTALSSSHNSLIVSILSAGTFFGSIIAGDLSDFFGRRATILAGIVIYVIGCILQTAAHGLALIVVGRLIAGFGVGFVSAITILYMSEIAPRKVRGALVAGYQFCITIGILLGGCVNLGVQNYTDTGSYRIPIGLQFIWAIILFAGIFYLPDSPRYYVKKGRLEDARAVLVRLRGQPADSEFVETELAEVVANEEYERQLMPATGYFGTWMHCFSGKWTDGNSNIRKTFLGTFLQMFQQWTGINFIFYFSTPFLQSTGAVSNPLVISLAFNAINAGTTPASFYMVEKLGRRPLLIWGAVAMFICEFIIGAVGVTKGFNKTHLNAAGISIANDKAAVNAQIAFICFYITAFATTWGPGAWIVIGEVFPLPIRSRGVALSTSSNWFWNCIIAVITPYLVGENEGNLKSAVFFMWGGMCVASAIFAYLFVPETKGLSLEQVDDMMRETTARNSAKWRPTQTYSSRLGLTEGHLDPNVVAHAEKGN